MSESNVTVADKDELLKLVNDAWASLVTATEHLTPEQWTGPVDPVGWTVKDHVAHVTAWDIAVVELIERQVPIQRTLKISDAAWTSGSFDAQNEEIRQQYLETSVDAIKTLRTRVFGQLVEMIEGFSDDELDTPREIAGMSKGERPLKVEFYDYFARHYLDHLGYIETILGRQA